MHVRRAMGLAAALWAGAAVSPWGAMALADEREKQWVEWQGDQVSDVFRVEALFNMLAQPETAQPSEQGPSLQEIWFANRGLDPHGTAARELREAALTLGLPEPIPQEVIEEYRRRHDESGFRAYQEARRAARLKAMGQLFGAWLGKREAEGYATAPLVDRLLGDGTVLRSDDGSAALVKQTALTDDAFRRGMRRELQELPPQFAPGRERQ